MVKKKVDARVRTLIENGVKTHHRSFFVLVGDHGKDQVVNLHYILSKAAVKARPNVLWCYKKELGFSTHRQKRMRQIKKQIQRGLHDPSKDDPFELFIGSTNIRWCYYKESQKILGSTYGMVVLQDFEAITPNIMARTIETVEGGGVVVLLLRTMSSLKKLYTMTMDVHDRLRTEAHQDVVARFNERFILSLASCKNCLVLDDELNVLPISKHARNIEPIVIEDHDGTKSITKEEQELKDLKESLKETQPVGSLVEQAKTMDQAKAILTFVEAISEKTLKNTVALTAARGRGKSAALGMALAGAVAYGYSNIFVTAPSPENLKTVFDFVFKGFDALNYKEHLDYEIIQSTNPEFNKAVLRVNIFREHRQTIQYIHPSDSEKLSQAELVAIDEAAAIPLPLVRKLLGPYLVFMSSTVNGYEGTGRSLSLKLIQKLREQQGSIAQAVANATSQIHGGRKGAGRDEPKIHEQRWQAANEIAHSGNVSGRQLREITLETPIRYGDQDPIEKWLNHLLCLDAGESAHRIVCGTPHPKDCELYYVNRDSLFSYHKLSENFLQRMMSLYVSSHYKNQPNDLQLMSDAPAHHLFVLLGPQAEGQGQAGQLPDILCVIQVALEGEISSDSVKAQLSRGKRANGDLIPWTVSQQFQDSEFAGLSGARIVRIATHPDVTKMGYGTRAIELLMQYYQGELTSELTSDNEDEDNKDEEEDENSNQINLQKEKVKPRKKLPPLLLPLTERRAERLHWFGTSFGLTNQLFKFWQRSGLHSVYVRQTANALTGEHTSIMLRALNCDDLPSSPANGWLDEFVVDARRRFISLLANEFRNLPVALSLGLLSNSLNKKVEENETSQQLTLQRSITGEIQGFELSMMLTPFDIKRLESYAKNMVDYHMIVDLLPITSRLFFLKRLPSLNLSILQQSIFVALGLQHKNIDALVLELNVPANQLLALFNKAIRKCTNEFQRIQHEYTEKHMKLSTKDIHQQEKQTKEQMQPTKETLDDELNQGQKEALIKMKQSQERLLNSLDVKKYAIRGTDEEWKEALENDGETALKLQRIQVKNQQTNNENEKKDEQTKDLKKKKKKRQSLDEKKATKKNKKSKYANLK